MSNILLFRNSIEHGDEIAIAREKLGKDSVVEFRSQIPRDSIVYCRYSCLPYYEWLEAEVRYLGASMVNTHAQHEYIASFGYYHDIKDYTFRTWNSLSETKHEGPFVVKGKTNSRKHQWSTHMYAATRQDAIRVAGELSNDSMIGYQGIVYREYRPLKTFEIGIREMRFTNEWRLFYLGKTLLSHGYYWSTASDEAMAKADISQEAFAMAQGVADILSEYVNFFVIDIAELESGGWIVVEINDAQMSGLSDNKPEILYENLAKAWDGFIPV